MKPPPTALTTTTHTPHTLHSSTTSTPSTPTTATTTTTTATTITPTTPITSTTATTTTTTTSTPHQSSSSHHRSSSSSRRRHSSSSYSSSSNVFRNSPPNSSHHHQQQHFSDFILLAEFCEQRGPVTLWTIPFNLSPPSPHNDNDNDNENHDHENFSADISPTPHPNLLTNFDFDSFVRRILSSDHTRKIDPGGCHSGWLNPTDTSVYLSDLAQRAHAYVHHLTLHDVEARGYVRPLCLCYVTMQELKVMQNFERLMRVFSWVSNLMKFGNNCVFLSDIERYMTGARVTPSEAFPDLPTEQFGVVLDELSRFKNAFLRQILKKKKQKQKKMPQQKQKLMKKTMKKSVTGDESSSGSSSSSSGKRKQKKKNGETMLDENGENEDLTSHQNQNVEHENDEYDENDDNDNDGGGDSDNVVMIDLYDPLYEVDEELVEKVFVSTFAHSSSSMDHTTSMTTTVTHPYDAHAHDHGLSIEFLRLFEHGLNSSSSLLSQYIPTVLKHVHKKGGFEKKLRSFPHLVEPLYEAVMNLSQHCLTHFSRPFHLLNREFDDLNFESDCLHNENNLFIGGVFVLDFSLLKHHHLNHGDAASSLSSYHNNDNHDDDGTSMMLDTVQDTHHSSHLYNTNTENVTSLSPRMAVAHHLDQSTSLSSPSNSPMIMANQSSSSSSDLPPPASATDPSSSGSTDVGDSHLRSSSSQMECQSEESSTPASDGSNSGGSIGTGIGIGDEWRNGTGTDQPPLQLQRRDSVHSCGDSDASTGLSEGSVHDQNHHYHRHYHHLHHSQIVQQQKQSSMLLNYRGQGSYLSNVFPTSAHQGAVRILNPKVDRNSTGLAVIRSGNRSLLTEMIRAPTTGTYALQLVQAYSFAKDVIYSVLTGVPVLICGVDKNEVLVRNFVNTLRLFVPGLQPHDQTSVIPWRTTPITALELTSKVKLAGMSKKITLSKSIESLACRLDIEEHKFIGPSYRGELLEKLCSLEKRWPDEQTFVSYIHSQFLEWGNKAAMYYHLDSISSIRSYFFPNIPQLASSSGNSGASSSHSSNKSSSGQTGSASSASISGVGSRLTQFLTRSSSTTSSSPTSHRQKRRKKKKSLEQQLLLQQQRDYVSMPTSSLSLSDFERISDYSKTILNGLGIVRRCDIAIIEHIAEVMKQRQRSFLETSMGIAPTHQIRLSPADKIEMHNTVKMRT